MSTPARFEELIGQELQQQINKLPLAWVPLGILEKHGEHLPYGLDGIKAHEVCLHLAGKLGGVVLPACHLCGVHEPILDSPQSDRDLFQRIGNFYLRPETFRMLLEDSVDGLLHIGFKMVVLYSGHYPKLQIAILDEVAARKTVPGKTFVYGFVEPKCFNAGDHAGKWETSLYMALGHEPRMHAIKPEQGDVLGFWFKYSPPTDASRGFGEDALTKLVEFFRVQIAQNLPK